MVAVDPERSWFRYHHLFGDLLALELQRTAPQEVPGLHTDRRRVVGPNSGYPVEAIRHAQAAENWGLAARLLADNWFGLYFDGRLATRHELLSGFPAGVLAADPELVVLAAADKRAAGSWGDRVVPGPARRGWRRRCPKTVAGALRSRSGSSDCRSLGRATTFGPLPRRRSDCSPQPTPPNLASARRRAHDVDRPRDRRDVGRSTGGRRAPPRAGAGGGPADRQTDARAPSAGKLGAPEFLSLSGDGGAARHAGDRAGPQARLGGDRTSGRDRVRRARRRRRSGAGG